MTDTLGDGAASTKAGRQRTPIDDASPWADKWLPAGVSVPSALQGLLSALPDGVLVVDAADRIVEANAPLCAMLQRSRASLLGIDLKSLPTAGDRHRVKDELTAVRQQDRSLIACVLDRGDGSRLNVEITLSCHEADRGLLFAILRDSTSRREANARSEFLSNHEALTGLLNRATLLDQLERTIAVARRQCIGVALCCLDLDAFARVNDACGVDAGDALLREVAVTLSKSIRETDDIAHLGGDEFALVLVGVDDSAQLEFVVRRSLDAISNLAEDSLGEPLTASCGTVLFPQDDGGADVLLRKSQQALFVAKQRGGDCCLRYESEHRATVAESAGVPEEIQRAIASDELQLYFQPRVDLVSGDVVAMQALVRWEHPVRGLLSPVDFLFQLRGTRSEIELERWIVAAGVHQYRKWQDQGLDLRIAINIGPRFFQHPDFLSTLQSSATGATAEPLRLELELLEVASLDDAEGVAKKMQACRDLGVSFGLDDFGNGYASLTYYHRLPVEILKIPRQFVRNMLLKRHDRDIVEGVMRLAATLDLPVVAEGVESREIAHQLLRSGCVLAQGYGIARPMPGNEVSAWMERWQAGTLCAELAAHREVAVEDPILDVALFSHLLWHDAVQRKLSGGESAQQPELDAESAPLGIWFRGIGREHFGDSEQFAQLRATHKSLYDLAQRLIAAASSNDVTAVASGMLEFEGHSGDFANVLRKLRVN